MTIVLAGAIGTRTLTQSYVRIEQNHFQPFVIAPRVNEQVRLDQLIKNAVNPIFASLSQPPHIRVTPSLFDRVILLGFGMIKGNLQREITRQAHLKNNFSFCEVISYMVSSPQERRRELETACFELEKQTDLMMLNLQELQENIVRKKQTLADFENKVTDLGFSLENVLTSIVERLPDSNFTREILVIQLPELIKQWKNAESTLEAELKEMEKLQADGKFLYRKAHANCNDLLRCPFSKKSLVDAIKIVSNRGIWTISAQYLGLKIHKGEIIRDPSSPCGDSELLKGTYEITWDIMTSTLAKELFVEDKSEKEIDLDDELIEDSVQLELVEDPILLKCGHTFSKKTIEGIHQCPLCRQEYNPEKSFPNNTIEDYVKAIKEKKIAVEKLEEIRPQLEELAIARETILVKIAKYCAEGVLFSNAYDIHQKIRQIYHKCRILENELLMETMMIKEIGEKLEKKRGEQTSFRMQLNSMNEKERTLVKAYESHDEDVVQQVKEARKELIGFHKEQFQQVRSIYEGALKAISAWESRFFL